MVNIGVVGYGYWGPNLVRNFGEEQGARVIAVSDLSAKRAELAQSRYPAISVTSDYRELIANPEVDLVVIATPVATHFSLSKAALEAGKHVLVEKPLTTSSEEGLRLIEEAEKRKLRLFVDHTFIYTGAVRKIRDIVLSGELGEIYYYDSVRVNLGLFQYDIDVIWDLAVHDLAIMNYVLPMRPIAVSATGMSHVAGATENIAYLTMFFTDNVIAHVHVNWLSPVKIRRTMVSGTRRMIVYDDMEASEKVKVYDRGIDVRNNSEARYKTLVNYRSGDMWAPQLDVTEALKFEVRSIIQALETGMRLETEGHAGLEVVRVLEAASESMRNRGQAIDLKVGRMTT